MLEQIVRNAPVFLLVAVRCFATILTIPLLSSRSISRMCKVALAGYMGYFLFSQVSLVEGVFKPYSEFISADGSFTLEYVLLLLGEGMIGIILGFFIQVIFGAFSTAGQFFAFQMGFTASEVYDSLSQVENPLLGQFLNFFAMLIFLQNHWLQLLFLRGLTDSFHSINAFVIINNSDYMAGFMMKSLSLLFKDSLIIALPIMASLFLVNTAVGILTKAAPQMNLLSEAFPVLILVAFFLMFLIIPQMAEFFEDSFYDGFRQITGLLNKLSVIPGGEQ